MPADRDPDEGTFAPSTTPEDIIAVFDDVPSPVIFVSDVTDALDITSTTAKNHLSDLVDAGRLAHRKHSGRNIYWLPDEDASLSE